VKEFEVMKSTFRIISLSQKKGGSKGAKEYHMDIKNVEGNQHFSALVTVPVAYPRHPPIFSL
jgi:hypothetical protein